MKKIILLFCLISSLALFGCESETQPYTPPDSLFITIKDDYCCRIVYHKDTKVMYVVSDSAYNYGSFTLLVNPDGTPMIYEE